jgi:hypothetical protein
VTKQTRSSIADHIRSGARWLGEFAFVMDSLLAAMLVAVVVIGRIDPLASAPMIGFVAATLVIIAVHHVWYARHRREIESGHEHQAGRERRGF